MTQLLSIAGAKLPSELLGANPGNEFGHFESTWMIDRDDRLLRDLGKAWDEWSRIDLEAAPGDVIATYVSDLRRFVQKELGDEALLVLKEPRTCRLLPPILRALRADDIEPLIVVPYRNPLEVAGSLLARDGISLREGVLLWLRHSIDAERDSRGCKRSFIAYEALFDDWRGNFQRMSKDLGIDWPRNLDRIAPEADKAIVRGARHNKWTSEDLEKTAYARGLALRVLEACESFAIDPADAGAMATMDAVSAQFEELVELTQPAIRDTRAALAAASTEAETQKQENARLIDRNTDLQHNLQGIWELHNIVSELNQKNDLFISDLRSQVAERQNMLVAANEARSGLELRVASSETARSAAEAEATRLGETLTELGRDFEAATAKLTRTEQDLLELRTDAADLATVAADRQAEAERLREALRAKQIESGHYAQGVKDRLAEIDNLTNMLREVYGSSSWRITRPLRFFGRAVRKVLRLLRGIARGIALAIWRLLPISTSKRVQWKNRLFSSSLGRRMFGSTALYQQWQAVQVVRFEMPAPAQAKSARPAQSADRFRSATQSATESRASAAGNRVEVDTANHFVPRRIQTDLTDPMARLIAFYLPQFHAIPENDAWWGKGFTEWTNVRPAKPMFPGHYQPHEPLDLGYYDLTDIEAQKRQIELAKLYGLGGFCFYWYWFGGKRLLEKPVENWLNNPELDFPFCVCWANENWTRRWDGKDSEIIMGQKHSPADDLAFIAELGPYLRDPRYIRINGKPLVLVYRPSALPDAAATAGRWRNWCRQNGIGEIYLAYTQSFELADPRVYGFDAAIEFPPNNASPTVLTDRIEGLDPEFNGIVYDWNFYVDRSRDYPQPDYRLIRSVCPAWDNTARRKKGGAIFLNNTPGEYATWLGNAITRTLADAPTPDERIIFCNAWNEWAEGAHLEPDTRFGYAWLETTRDALDPHATPRHVTLIGHDAHPHGAQLLLLNLARSYRQAGLTVKIVLLDGGSLVKDYAEVAQVAQLPDLASKRDEALRLLRGLRSEHGEVAVVNTTVSGSVAPLLQEAGYSPVALIHEMRSVYAQMDLKRQMQALAVADAPLVFPARIVQAQFEEALGQAVTRPALRPQGLYLRPAPRDPVARDALRAEYAIPAGAPLVLGVGYIDHRKGADLFVQALAEMRKAGIPAEAIWIGHADRDELPRVAALAKQLGVADHVRFPGRQPDPARFYAAADLFLLTSREDPYPSVVLEAMAAELPVVMFAGVTGSEDLAARGLAVAVTAENPQAMAEAAANLLVDAPAREAMVAAAARHIADETSFTEYAFDLLKLGGKPVPRISVIVPSYNYQDYIRDRIESVAAQDMPILEIIVLDDCSTDRSPEIIAEIAASSPAPIRFVPGRANSGNVFKQWQKGLELARGDYIWIAEADDLAAPDFLSTVMRGFEAPGVVLSYCESAQIDGKGNPLAADYRYYTNGVAPGKWDRNYLASGQAEIEQALFLKNTILNASAVVMRTDALRAVFAAHREEIEGLRFAGDWAVYLNLLAKGDIAYSALSKNYHRRHQSSVTISNFNALQLDEIIAMQRKARALIGADPQRDHRSAAYIAELEQQFGVQRETAPETESRKGKATPMTETTPVNRPDIFIVGTMKGGTTVLHEFMALHPEIHAGTKKEIHYFTLFETKGLDWYHDHFKDLPAGQHYLDASPTYFDMATSMGLPARIESYNPDARVIMLARDPVERAVSHFNHFRKVNKIPALQEMSADEFFSRDLELALGQINPIDFYLMQCIDFSLYFRKAHNYRKVFGDRFMVVDNDDLSQQPQETMERVFRHVGVDPIRSEGFNQRKYSHQGDKSGLPLEPATIARLNKIFGANYNSFCNLTGLRNRNADLVKAAAAAKPAPVAMPTGSSDHGGGARMQELAAKSAPDTSVRTENGVLVGKDDWLFLWDGSNEVHRYYTEPDYFTDKDVQDWVDLLTARRDRIEALGATYRHMTVPDKLSLLPDMAGVPLPNFDRHPASLIAARLPGDGLNIDILSDLREAGKEAPVFYRTDSHWNSFGCQVAYRRLCAILGATPRDFSDRKSGGKLMSMDLGQKLAPPLQEEARFTIVKRDAQRVSENEPVRYNEQTGFREGKPRFVGCHVHLRNDSPDARPETLLLFGDSYSEFRPHLLTAMLAETYRDVHFVWSANLDFDLIERLRPQIVISQIAERFMRTLPTDEFQVSLD
ncbi:glycoside hydrolase family 99-like domain-containing protein [Paracoccus lutimaris]|uniref:glycoside hydrolase family 99-like domain-containing protein n=1 Tax=Paracoccus lutimaris TaxID=1490030 RepID=UPI000DF2066E|nr:glycoside hydrolase family 99-like domain-containing protein [Paracoccus lutimaris]